MKRSWAVDAFVGLFLTAIVAAGYYMPALFPAFWGLELKAYDRRAQLRQNLDPSKQVVIVAVDDASLSSLGRWPWPRYKMAALLDKVAAARPKVIGLDVVFSEPEQNQGLLELQSLKQQYDQLVSSHKLTDRGGSFGQLFASEATRLDSDSQLVAAVQRAGNVVLPMFFADAPVIGAKVDPLPVAISSSTVSAAVSSGSDLAPREGVKAVFPLEELARGALGVGHVNVDADFDGTVRREPTIIKYAGAYVPSFALQLVLAYTGIKPSDASFVPGHRVQLRGKALPLDDDSEMLITFNGPDHTFSYYSAQDVMNDHVSPDALKDKIVLVGLTATGIATLYVTPVAHNFPSVEMVANVIENILDQKFLVRPPWAERLEWLLIILMGVFVMLGLPRLKALWAFLVSALILVGLVGAGVYLFLNGQWIKVAYPGALLALGYVVITTKRFFVTERGKELVEASAVETNKMLGLSFQGQGMLDMAFEKFRLCPLDNNMKDTLYNLSLDFERKRQFAKAAAVLDHIKTRDPKYKDVAEKSQKLKQASEGAVFGGVGGAKKEGTVLISGGDTKPTLGRYEIEKELGRGAMGIVYLGKDPKINRQVAIKTMMLEEGSDSGELKAVKERFFREAESAGTLNHPNIVRIFDAGEEQDIAYIAMELLEGHDFTQYTGKGALLPVGQVLEHVASVADALDYAHQRGIVHRDIKPANIMMLKDGTIRVADFGIARITTSSKTATGTVMGTPSYMSPEQVAGKKVDGRSDLFSLTVTLFELLTGEKPFKGGEGIGTLLFQIANDPHPDLRSINPNLPESIAKIIDKGLAKNPDERYAKGALMAGDLRACVAALKAGGSLKEATLQTEPVKQAAPAPAPSAAPASPAEPGVQAVLEQAAAETASPADANLTETARDLLADLKAAELELPTEAPAPQAASGEPTMIVESAAPAPDDQIPSVEGTTNGGESSQAPSGNDLAPGIKLTLPPEEASK